ncbi:MAG: DUF5676 family membrane protein, partial [Nitrospirota bacterium]|jgi:hypothetical protein
VIRPIPFANALTVTAAGLAAFLIALRALTPQFFVLFFNAQFFGADVASLLPAEPKLFSLVTDLLALLAGAWLFGFVWAVLYNRWVK